MQQATLAPMTAIISPAFCLAYPLDLSIVWDKNFWTLKHGGFLVTDAKNCTYFKVKGSCFLSLRDRRVLLDVVDCPIVTFRRKMELDVYLARNTAENAPDFRVQVSWLQGTFKVYTGNSSNVIAKIKKEKAVLRMLFLKDNFNVTVNPGVDYTLS